MSRGFNSTCASFPAALNVATDTSGPAGFAVPNAGGMPGGSCAGCCAGFCSAIGFSTAAPTIPKLAFVKNSRLVFIEFLCRIVYLQRYSRAPSEMSGRLVTRSLGACCEQQGYACQNFVPTSEVCILAG